ncbi:MAG TPA: SIMPL domain-containing protein [Ohtaekwangia sp.]|uniref:SIMPL domain-containing protein n=1 Tax=Ohtaekwangia sp. TaxID=2066019 RepID=UPI002F932DE0
MKSNVLFSVFLFISTITFAQEGFKGEHFIEVTGTAKQEIDPNEIYVSVQLKEFEESREKVLLEKLDKEFWEAVKAANIDRKKVELANAGSQFGKLGRKEKDAFREKTYQLKLSSGAELENLLAKIEPVKVNQVMITKVTHSDIEKFRLDLKIKALQAAKAKADALVKSIGSEIGKPLMVREFENYYPMANENVMIRGKVSFDGAAGDVAEDDATAFRKITLQAQVTAQFEIK